MLRHQEEAVSPVVGVMLMLVVTIINASVVSAFAGGLWGNTDKAPGVTIQASIVPQNITLTHMGGDPFQIKDLKLIVSNDSYSIVFTNTSVNATLYKSGFNIADGNSGTGLISAGDKFTGGNSTTSYFISGQEYKWSIIHIPSQKTIATGKAYT
jgi:FlaG/FlaF family flagellin (archaellin)